MREGCGRVGVRPIDPLFTLQMVKQFSYQARETSSNQHHFLQLRNGLLLDERGYFGL
jgi:hypothetical protein